VGLPQRPYVPGLEVAGTIRELGEGVDKFNVGETVLVHGALGGLASTFPGVARSLGASKVVGTVRPTSLATAEAAGLPYDRLIPSDEFPTALTDERFNVGIDPVGGDLRTASLDVMAPLGRLLAVGNASGDWQHGVETDRLWRSNLAILGFSVGFYLPTHLQLARPAAEGALKAVSEGLIDFTRCTS
jgi:NADPH2:quinone reductase